MNTVFLILLVVVGLSVSFTRVPAVVVPAKVIPSLTPVKPPSGISYVIAIQNSAGVRRQLEKIIKVGKSIVAANCPGDETMIIRFVGRDKIEIEQPLTRNKKDLNDALDNLFIGGGQAAIVDAVYLSIKNLSGARSGNQKALILITNGNDYNSYYNEKLLIDLSRKSKVPISAIGFFDDVGKDDAGLSDRQQSRAKAFLERLTQSTGGKVFIPDSSGEIANSGKQVLSSLRSETSTQCQ